MLFDRYGDDSGNNSGDTKEIRPDMTVDGDSDSSDDDMPGMDHMGDGENDDGVSGKKPHSKSKSMSNSKSKSESKTKTKTKPKPRASSSVCSCLREIVAHCGR